MIRSGVDFHVLVDLPDPMLVFGDSYRVNQTVFNFLDNAAKFTQFGSIQFVVSEVPQGPFERDHKIKFTLRDTGIGISSDNLTHLFSAFYQVLLSLLLGISSEIFAEVSR